jgi:hypothetical protein
VNWRPEIDRQEKTMTTQMTATVVNGILKPDQTLPLPDQSRVRLTIEPIQEWSQPAAVAAWQALTTRLRLRPIHGGGRRFTRDELHERR